MLFSSYRKAAFFSRKPHSGAEMKNPAGKSRGMIDAI